GCDFGETPGHADEGESSEIGTGDEQNESGGAHEGDGAGTQLGGESLLKRNGEVGNFQAGIFAFDLRDAIGPGAIQLGIGLLPGCRAVQAEDDAEVGALSFALRAGLKRCVEVGVERCGGVLREDADDRVGFAFEVDGLANEIAIGSENAMPEVVAEYDGLRPFGRIFGSGEGASEGGSDAKHVEVV